MPLYKYIGKPRGYSEAGMVRMRSVLIVSGRSGWRSCWRVVATGQTARSTQLDSIKTAWRATCRRAKIGDRGLVLGILPTLEGDLICEVESPPMSRVNLGVLLGLGIGIVDVLLMLPLSFPDKRSALLGAFCARFALGFFAATARLPMSPIATGILVGLLTSLPDAIITKAYAPIIATGLVFGAVAGWIVGRWASPF